MLRRRERAVRASVLGVSLAVAGCSRPSTVAGKEAAAHTTAAGVADPVCKDTGARDAGLSAADRLAAEAVTDQDFARRVFYSWTTREQVAELVAGANLLTRQESPDHGPAEIDWELNAVLEPRGRGGRGDFDGVALGLRGANRGLTYRRFAWTTAWPTTEPQGPVPYGDQLLRITLKPRAIIARFQAYVGQRWSFVRTDGTKVSEEEVVANLDQLGAIFHVRDAGEYAYREYILCNETMIEEWSTGDPLAKAQLEADADLMHGLAESPPPDGAYDAAIAFRVVSPYITPPPDFAGREAKLRAALASQAATLVRRPALLYDSTAVVLEPRPRRYVM